MGCNQHIDGSKIRKNYLIFTVLCHMALPKWKEE